MKKLISIIISLLVAFSCTGVYAETLGIDVEAERLLKLVKERLPDTLAYESFDSSSYEQDGRTVYSFDWYTSSESGYSSMNVECSESGIICGVHIYNSSEEKSSSTPSIKKISQKTAFKNAEEIVRKLNPTLSDKLFLKLSEEKGSLFSDGYTFEIVRKENGIEVYGDGGGITLDSSAEKLKYFYMTYTENAEFSAPEGLISIDEAKELYGNKLGLELKYLSVGDGDKLTVIPCYTEKSSAFGKYINAVTGEVFEPKYDGYRFNYAAADTEEAVSSGGASANNKQFSEAELSEIDALGGLISKSKITDALKKNKYLKLPNGFELKSTSLSKDALNKTYTYGFSYEKIKDSEYGFLNFSADAETGLVKRYTLYGSDARYSSISGGKKTFKLGREKAYAYLKEAIGSLAKDIISEYEETAFSYPETSDGKNGYNAEITYTRYINGIPYEYDCISARLNLVSGNIESYRAGITNADFPSSDGLISGEDALKTLFENVSYEVKYVLNGKTAAPVYMLSDSDIIIDAESGVMLGYDLKELTDGATAYSDLEGHYAEDIIYELANYGISFSGNSFRPEEEIRQGDCITLLVSAFYSRYGSSYTEAEAYERAIRNGIIMQDEVCPDGTVTRGDAAKYMTRLLGYAELAKADDIFATVFADSGEYTGYASIMYGLGIMKGSNGLFKPYENLKRAEAAVMLYNYLTR